MAEIDEFTEALFRAYRDGCGQSDLFEDGLLAVARVALERAAEVAGYELNRSDIPDAIRALIPKETT